MLHDVSERPATVVLVARDGSETVVGRLDPGPPDLDVLDALARLQLTARRSGYRVLVRDPPPGLRGLLELAGLAGVLVLVS